MARRGGGPFLGRWRTPKEPALPVDPALALTRTASALYTWNLATDALAWSPGTAGLLGLPDMSALASGQAFAEAVEPGSGAGREAAIGDGPSADAGCDGFPYAARYALRLSADRLVMVEDTGRWLPDAEGRPALAHGMIRVHAAGDEDSGLRARTDVLARLADEVAEAHRSRHTVLLVAGDLGSDSEAALSAVAERLRPLMRRRDRFIPYGPDRFALTLSSCPIEEAERALARLHALLAGLGVRLGAAHAPEQARTASDLLRRAEEARDRAVEGGSTIYQPRLSMPEARPRSGTNPFDLVDALNERRLVAAFRPVRDARGRDIVLSTLVPCLKGPDGLSPAGDLACAAAAGGLSVLVDARLTELAASHLDAHPGERVILPVAADSLQDPDWLAGLAAQLGARPTVTSRLLVEVAESALAASAVRGRLDALKALGVGIVLAGFGGGHGRTRDLRSLPVDLLRIDGALIQPLGRSTDDRLLVRSLVDLAQHLGIATLAEWVGDEASARLLAEWGVDYIEGPLAGAAALPAENQTRRRTAAA